MTTGDYASGDLVRRPTNMATGRVLRTDNHGVFVEWGGDHCAYFWPRQLVLVGEGEVSRLRRLVRWLHPDKEPDPATARLLLEAVGDRDFKMFCEVIATGGND